MDWYFPEGNGIFQDDNARIHRAKIVQNWYSANDETFEHMTWPPQSPDLNPIENLRDELERNLRSSSPLPSTVASLGERLLQLWPKIALQRIQKLLESMPS